MQNAYIFILSLLLLCVEEHPLVDEASHFNSLGFHWDNKSLKTHFFKIVL